MSELPKGWEWATIGDLTLPVSKVDPRSDPDREFEYIDIGGVDGDRGDILDTQRLKGSEAPSRARQLVRAGDTVLSTVRTYMRKTAQVTPRLDGQVASTGFSVLRPADGVHPMYLYHSVRRQEFVDTLSALQSGSSYPAVRDKDVRLMPVPLAPRAEQERIVVAIEEHLSRLDSAEAAIVSASRRLPALLGGMMTAAFDREAPTVAIGQVATVGSGATPKRTDRRYWADGHIPWVTSGALNSPIVSEPSSFLTEAALAATAVKLWPAGTVLVAMYGEGRTRGRAAELAFDSTCNQACAAIRVDPSALRPRFLRWFLNSRYQQTRRLGSGGVQPNLSLGLIKSMKVPLIDLEQQDVIIERLEGSKETTDRLLADLAGGCSRSQALRRSLLTAAFSGQLVPQDPDDEPASVLLERIRAERVASAPAKRTRKAKAS